MTDFPDIATAAAAARQRAVRRSMPTGRTHGPARDARGDRPIAGIGPAPGGQSRSHLQVRHTRPALARIMHTAAMRADMDGDARAFAALRDGAETISSGGTLPPGTDWDGLVARHG